MRSSTKQPKTNLPASEPSPWTEPFQRAQEAAAAKQAANQAQTAPKPTDRAEEPTHAALSTIFNSR